MERKVNRFLTLLLLAFILNFKSGTCQSIKTSRVKGGSHSRTKPSPRFGADYTTCERPDPPNAASMRCHQNSDVLVCSATCIEGFEFPSGYPSTIELTCDLDTGRWAPEDRFPDCAGEVQEDEFQRHYQQNEFYQQPHSAQLVAPECDRPAPPMGGSMRCSQSSNIFSCSATCVEGFYFPDNYPETIELECGSDGEWYPFNEFPDCIRQELRSQRQYANEYQQQKAFGQEDYGYETDYDQVCVEPSPPYGGTKHCVKRGTELYCEATCLDGFSFPRSYPSAVTLTCDAYGNWYPYDEFPDCVAEGGASFNDHYQAQQRDSDLTQRHYLHGPEQQLWQEDYSDYEIPKYTSPSACRKPIAPSHGTIYCTEDLYEKQCQATCNPGFEFPDRTVQAMLTCNLRKGYWLPTHEFDDCQLQCHPPCQNGGICSSHNICDCPSSYRGNRCQYSVALCDFNRLHPRMVAFNCSHLPEYSECHISCAPGMTFDPPSTNLYRCTVDGLWNPPTAPTCIRHSVCDQPPSPMNGRIACSGNNEYLICRGSCRSGYIFPDRFNELVIQCSYHTGQWSPTVNFEDCIPVCNPECENGGRCIGHNQCLCTSEYRGTRCEYAIANCDYHAFLMSVVAECRVDEEETVCQISCGNTGAKLEPPQPTVYTCSLDGTWNPAVKPTCQSDYSNIDRRTSGHSGRYSYSRSSVGHSYQSGSQQSSVNEVRYGGFGGGQASKDMQHGSQQSDYPEKQGYGSSGGRYGQGHGVSGSYGGYGQSFSNFEHEKGSDFDTYGQGYGSHGFGGNRGSHGEGQQAIGHEFDQQPANSGFSDVPADSESDLIPWMDNQQKTLDESDYEDQKAVDEDVIVTQQKSLETSAPKGKTVHSYVDSDVEIIKNARAGNKIQKHVAANYKGICSVWGYPHIRTFDGTIYSFTGTCSYVLAKDNQHEGHSINLVHNCPHHTEYVDINAKVERMRESDAKNCLREVEIRLPGEHYKLSPITNLTINGEPLPIPIRTGTGVVVEKVSLYKVVRIPGFTVWMNDEGTIRIVADSSKKGQTSGLCGNFDHKEDDFRSPDGEIMHDIMTFGNSWKTLDSNPDCVDTPPHHGPCQSDTMPHRLASDKASLLCESIHALEYADCHELVDPEPYYALCQMDCCAVESAEGCECATLGEYFKECAREGDIMEDGWRRPALCPLTCTNGTEYRECGPACRPTCARQDLPCVHSKCVDGCHCPDGTVFEDGQCIPLRECPCTYGRSKYASGETLRKDCNTCICQGGRWECTEEICPATCDISGPHYTTFDGLRYYLHSKCPHYLVFNNDFTVSVDYSTNCRETESSQEDPICIRSITITTPEDAIVKLKPGFEVIVNGQETESLPVSAPGVYVGQGTSMFMKATLKSGLSITWDGGQRIFVTAPADLFDKTAGLCGTFNHKQMDDFLTPEGDIEAIDFNFAIKWKVDPFCHDSVQTAESTTITPCDRNSHRYDDAVSACSILKIGKVFDECHDFVDPEPYYTSCMEDYCDCQLDTHHCLCTSLGNYAAVCARKGHPLPWRSEIPECVVHCPVGEIYTDCANSCSYSCAEIAKGPLECEESCMEGCVCPPGMTMDNHENKCVPVSSCHCTYSGRAFPPEYLQRRGSEMCECSEGQWACRKASASDVILTPPTVALHCSKEAHLIPTDCVSECPVTCINYHHHNPCTVVTCEPGCECEHGYIFDTTSDTCVLPHECPCHHSGENYPEDTELKIECNDCTCRGGQWECDTNPCPGLCNVYGDSHYKTFDGHVYDFQGECNYELLRGYATDDSIISIIVHNMPCGTTGVTCGKAVTVSLGDYSITLSKDEPMPIIEPDSGISMREVGMFTIVHITGGIAVQWDRGTRIHVTAQPSWRTKLLGLCGDFNGDATDDFKPPSGGIPLTLPKDFVDSWRVYDYCNSATEITDACENNPERRSWARNKCAVLQSELFKPCHTQVDAEEYYRKCMFDACACDTGGDCECFCAVVAAYSQECARKGFPVPWRSQDLCPVQCEECDHYSPCISTCEPVNCENYQDDEISPCTFEPCVEGCEPKYCPTGYIRTGPSNKTCIKVEDCTEKPCIILDGIAYKEGARIENSDVGDDCQSCHCIAGEIKCEGLPCTTTVSATTLLDIMKECELTGWTDWINSNNPEDNNGNDKEDLEDLVSSHRIPCPLDHIRTIECREVSTGTPSEASYNIVSCDIKNGLICRKMGSKECSDFEVRVYCDCSEKEMCPPNQHYEECAYHCGSLCHSLQYDMAASEECEFLEEKCVPGCVEKTCEPPFLRRDAETCVLPESCTCKLYDGTLLAPGSTGVHGCQKCQCSNNEVTCMNLLECEFPEEGRGEEPWYTTIPTPIFTTPVPIRPAVAFPTEAKPPKIVPLPATITVEETTTTAIPIPTKPARYPIPPGLRTTTVVCSHWSDWINRNVPKRGRKNGDIEDTLPFILKQAEGFCQDGIVSEIECREASAGIDYTETDEKNLTCDLDHGFICKNRDQPDKLCMDYEIRYYCNCEAVETTTIYIRTTTKTHVYPCTDYVQLIDGLEPLPDSSLKTSSNRSPVEGAEAARLSTQPAKRKGKTTLLGGSWTAEKQDEHQFIEVDLGEVRAIYGIITEGKVGSNDWVTAYRVLYSTDGDSYNYYDDENDKTKIFSGNYDSSSEVRHIFEDPFEARYVRLEPVNWEGSISLRFDLLGCSEAITSTVVPAEFVVTVRPITPKEEVCKDPMGLEEGLISDFQLSASSVADPLLSAKQAKLGSELAWMASRGDPNPYIQVDFIDPKNITAVITKGREDFPSWVTSFEVAYSKDGETWNKVTDESGYPKEFPANYDESTPVTNFLPAMIRTRFLRVIPTNSKEAVALQLEVLGCYHPVECRDPMGIENGLINKHQISASSEKDDSLAADNGRLNSLKSWSPLSADKNQFIQVDFLSPVNVTGVVTKGRHDALEWVTDYQLSYSNDNKKWKKVKNEDGEISKFTGNSDTDSPVINLLPEAIEARLFRIMPTRWIKWPSMRFDLLGCHEEKECLEPMGLENGLLKDSQLTASSSHDLLSTPSEARIDSKSAWTPDISDKFPYLEINFGIPQNVSAVVTKGREIGEPDGWVTSYKVAYKNEDGDIDFVRDDNNIIKIFRGNEDEDSPVVNVLGEEPIETSAIQIIPIASEGALNLRVEILGCLHPMECQEPMGLENGMIMDSQLSASSSIRDQLGADRGRLSSDTAWSAGTLDDEQFLMVDLMEPRNITGLLTAGRKDLDERVISYRVEYSTDGSHWETVTRNRKIEEFLGSYADNPNQPKLSIFPQPITARYIKINPTEWENWISMRLEVLGCYHPHVCKEPMGLENGMLTNSQITASSYLNDNTRPSHARLNDESFWTPLEDDDQPYLQIDFNTPKNVTAIITKGSPETDEYVSAYKVAYSDDDVFWDIILQENGKPMVFEANVDSVSPVINNLPKALETQYLRIIPLDWYENIALQLEVLGCSPEEVLAMTVPPSELTFVHECPDKSEKETSLLEDAIITASSSAPNSNPELVRIGTVADTENRLTGGWVPKVDDLHPFIIIEFPQERTLLGVQIQGRQDADQRVKSFRVVVSEDNETWFPVFGPDGDEIIQGNEDSSEMVGHYFKDPVIAKFVKVIPEEWHKWPSFRMDLRGCYHVPEELLTTLVPILAIKPELCPEVPASFSDFCPDSCPEGQLCNVVDCVDAVDCQCLKDGRTHKVGDLFQTMDCERCYCILGGHSKCSKLECPPCPSIQKSYLGPRCECECEECPEDTAVCPTSGECVPIENWCDGVVDCPDDETDCFTSTTETYEATTGVTEAKLPKKKVKPAIATTLLPELRPTEVPETRILPGFIPTEVIGATMTPKPPKGKAGVAATLPTEFFLTSTVMPIVVPDVCEIQPPHIKQFDGPNIIYSPCHHLALVDILNGRFNITVHNTPDDHSIDVSIPEHKAKIISGQRVVLDGHEYSPAQLVLLNNKPEQTLIIEKLGDHVVVKAPKLGFEVLSNTLGQLSIQVLPTLKEEISGLCGFYSGNEEHSMSKPNGKIAYTAKEFGDSWATEDDEDCKEPLCDKEKRSKAHTACEELSSEDFRPCAEVVDLGEYMDTCQDFMCQCLEGSEYEECKCKSFMPVIEKCIEKLGLGAVKGWRVKHNCSPPECPETFVWEDCGPSCQITCATPMSSDLENCANECMSGCFCPEGTLLDGEICVPPDQCSNEVCHGFGDPHMETFDGYYFPFQAEGTFLFAADEGAEFAVQGITEPCDPESNKITCITGIKVTHYGHSVTVRKTEEITVDEKIINVDKWPLIVYGMTVIGYPGKTYIILIPSLSVDVRYYGDNSGFAVKIPATRFFNRTLGLCGNCDGKVDENPKKEYACGWLVKGSKESCLKSFDDMPVIEEPNDACLKLMDDEIFGTCHALVDPQNYVSACSFDITYSGEEEKSVCKTLMEYARQCCQAGVVIKNWAERFGCEVGCDHGLEYNSCHDGCPQTCEAEKNSFLVLGCEKIMLDGCFCPEGKVYKDGKCVDFLMCDACDDEGHMPGDVWAPESCKNCTCRKNLIVECSTESCPPVPICKSEESLVKLNSDKETCCNSYTCVPAPVTCPPVDEVPSCKEGEILKTVTSDDFCPEFQCVCDPITCQPVGIPENLETGQVADIERENCCPKVVIRCEERACPEKPSCNPGLIAVEYEGECCILYRCKPPTDVCVYTPHYAIEDGVQVFLEATERQPVFYQPGETWSDGLCENCTCTKNDEQLVPTCVMEQCPDIDNMPESKDYELHGYENPHQCCPDILKLQCKDEFGNLYLPGDEWQSYEDPCTKFVCEATKLGDALKIKKVIDCPECPKTADYVPPSKTLSQCCGFCRPSKCEDGDNIYFVGDEWIPESNPCQKAECINDFGSVKIIYTNPSCPVIPEDCPTDKIVDDVQGCCRICNETTEMRCNSAPIPVNETIGFFQVFDPSRGGLCKNEESVPEILKCSGACHSQSYYSVEDGDFKSVCQCCKVNITIERDIEMQCPDGSVIKKAYLQPQTCQCSKCGPKKEANLWAPEKDVSFIIPSSQPAPSPWIQNPIQEEEEDNLFGFQQQEDDEDRFSPLMRQDEEDRFFSQNVQEEYEDEDEEFSPYSQKELEERSIQDPHLRYSRQLSEMEPIRDIRQIQQNLALSPNFQAAQKIRRSYSTDITKEAPQIGYSSVKDNDLASSIRKDATENVNQIESDFIKKRQEENKDTANNLVSNPNPPKINERSLEFEMPEGIGVEPDEIENALFEVWEKKKEKLRKLKPASLDLPFQDKAEDIDNFLQESWQSTKEKLRDIEPPPIKLPFQEYKRDAPNSLSSLEQSIKEDMRNINPSSVELPLQNEPTDIEESLSARTDHDRNLSSLKKRSFDLPFKNEAENFVESLSSSLQEAKEKFNDKKDDFSNFLSSSWEGAKESFSNIKQPSFNLPFQRKKRNADDSLSSTWQNTDESIANLKKRSFDLPFKYEAENFVESVSSSLQEAKEKFKNKKDDFSNFLSSSWEGAKERFSDIKQPSFNLPFQKKKRNADNSLLSTWQDESVADSNVHSFDLPFQEEAENFVETLSSSLQEAKEKFQDKKDDFSTFLSSSWEGAKEKFKSIEQPSFNLPFLRRRRAVGNYLSSLYQNTKEKVEAVKPRSFELPFQNRREDIGNVLSSTWQNTKETFNNMKPRTFELPFKEERENLMNSLSSSWQETKENVRDITPPSFKLPFQDKKEEISNFLSSSWQDAKEKMKPSSFELPFQEKANDFKNFLSTSWDEAKERVNDMKSSSFELPFQKKK